VKQFFPSQDRPVDFVNTTEQGKQKKDQSKYSDSLFPAAKTYCMPFLSISIPFALQISQFKNLGHLLI
jgi:hypothetical protein